MLMKIGIHPPGLGKLLKNFIHYLFCLNNSNDYLISTICIISFDLALKIYDGNINIKHLITIYWYFYHIFCIFISNKFIHICYCLAMNDASFSFSQCSELQAITSLKKSQLVFSKFRFIFVLNLYHRHLVSMVKVLHQDQYLFTVAFHIVPLLSVVCCCFLTGFWYSR